MSKKQIIIYQTFSFLLVIPFLLLIELIDSNYKLSIGFCIGWIVGNIVNQFWSKPVYIDNIYFENNSLTIEYLNPLLKKGIEKYDFEKISDFKIKKKSLFDRSGRIEFKFDESVIKYAYLKMDKENIVEKTTKLFN
ncbi:hypothetical protein M0D21_08110 [Aquimarina sp. D1M17]|uniref:hypothetical protein n=1 Tax=Aquimarina acroporae TaxID=2937283 RepID=UPI0020BD8D03|nr:hypothetical protein [Aquimarina acroporae]MCK8521528.1 hypothetical protein [Aquimarina acroporae]